MRSLFLILLTTILLAGNVHSQTAPDNEIIDGLNEIYDLKFPEAGARFKRLQSSFPNDLKGFFYESVLYFYKALPTRDEAMLEKYLELSEKVIEKAESILDKNENDNDALYYKGLSHSYRSLLLLTLNKSLLQAASDGNDGYRLLTALKEKNPQYYDADMGLGLYKIMISYVPEKFQWLLSLIGFKGNLKEGISQLRIAMDKGKFSRTDSKVFLALFSIKEKEDEDNVSLNYSRELSEQYPESPVFKVFNSGFLLQNGDVNGAIRLAEESLALNTHDFRDEIKKSASAILGTAYFRLNDFTKASQYLEEYTKYIHPQDRFNVYMYTLGSAYELSGNRSKAIEKYRLVRDDYINERDGELDRFFYRLAQEQLQTPISELEKKIITMQNFNESDEFQSSLDVSNEVISKNLLDNASDDDKAKFFYQYGLTNVYLKNHDYAIEAFNKCISLKPSGEVWIIPHSYFELGKLYHSLGQSSKSEEMFENIFDYDDFDFESFLEMRLSSYRKKM